MPPAPCCVDILRDAVAELLRIVVRKINLIFGSIDAEMYGFGGGLAVEIIHKPDFDFLCHDSRMPFLVGC
jgi:hypothetical protein